LVKKTPFRFLSKPLAHLNQHLEGCLEGGIDVQIVGETNPASITMVGEHATYEGVRCVCLLLQYSIKLVPWVYTVALQYKAVLVGGGG
jgi:hypothetical protein